MKRILLIIIGISTAVTVKSQTKEYIDSLKDAVLKNIENYRYIKYISKKILNEDALQYDTAYFYRDKEKLTYMKWQTRSYYSHMMGDGIRIIELFFLNEQAVFRRRFSYSFENPHWNLEEDIKETKVSVIESTRHYFKEDGTCIIEYESREAKGRYKDRFTLLDSIPLVGNTGTGWLRIGCSDRCESCIEDYMKIYRSLIEE